MWVFFIVVIGSFVFVLGLFLVLCYVWLEFFIMLLVCDWGLIVVLGLGLLGGVFFFWDVVFKWGDVW